MNVNSAGKMTSEEAGDTDPSAVPDEPPAAGSEGTGAEAGSQDRSTEEGVEKPAEGGDRAEDEAEVDGAAEEGGVQVEDGAASEDRESPASAGGDPDEQERDAEAQEAAEEMGGEEEGRGGETGEGEGKGEGKGGEEREEVEARVEEGQGTGDEGAQGSGASDREDATEEASGIDAGKNDERYSIRDAPWADEGGVAGDWGPEEVPASAGALAKQLILNFYQQRRMEQTVVGILSHNVVHNTGAWSGVRRAVAGRLLYGETLRDLVRMGLLDASLMPSIRALGYTERLESDSGMQSQSSAAWGGSPLRGEGIRPYEPAQAGSQDGVGGHQGHGPAPQAELTEGASIEHPQTWGARAARAGVFKAKSKQTLLAHKAQGAFMDEARRAQEGKARMQELERLAEEEMRNEKTKMRERKKSETSPNRVRRLASLVKGRGEDEARGKTHGAGHGATLRRRPHPFAHGGGVGITASMTRGSMARGNPRAAGLARGTMTRGAGDYLPSLARGVKRGRAMDTLGMQMAGNGGPLPSLVSGMGGFGAWPAHV